MYIAPMTFAPETFNQANPVVPGVEAAQQMYSNAVMNQYAKPMAQQALYKAMMNNQVLNAQAQNAMPQQDAATVIAQNNAQYAPLMSQNTLANSMAQRGLQGAQAGYFGANAANVAANTNLTNQTMPYKVQQARGSVYTDPVLSRLYQITQANQTGQIAPSLLRTVGFGGAQQQTNNNAAMPDLNSTINSASQGNNQVSPNQMLPPNAYGSQPNPISSAIQNQNMTPATAPKAFGGDAAQNFAMFGTPYNPIEMKAMQTGAETQAKTNVTQWNDSLNDAQKESNLGYQLSNFANQFQTAYKNSTYKGPVEGKLPSSGYSTALIPGDLTNEQITDNAAQNAASLMAKLVVGGRVTGYEFQYMNTLKPNRAMTPAAAQMTSDFLLQRAKQMQQYPSFLNAAQKQGLDPHTADVIWNMYRNQRPVYNFQTRQPNTQFDGTWNQFLNPQAVQAAQSGQQYTSIPNGYLNNPTKFSQWYATLNPQDRASAAAQYQRAHPNAS